MKTLFVALVSAVVTLVPGVIVIHGQAPAQRPAAAAPLVRIDAYPTADGQIVTDLTVDNFEVREDNVVQTIESFERVALDAPRPAAATPPAAGRLAPGERTRIVVVFLDTFNIDTVAVRAMYKPLTTLLESALGPDDVIAVMTPEMSAKDITFARKGGGVEVALGRVAEFSGRDESRLRDADEERYLTCYPEDERAPCGDSATSSYAGVAREMAARRREQRVMAALTDLSRTLESVNDSRKGVLVLSRGWALFRESPKLARLGNCGGRSTRDPLDFQPPGQSRGGRGSREADGVDQTICEADRRKLAAVDTQYEFKRMMDGSNRGTISYYPVDADAFTPSASRADVAAAGPAPAVDRLGAMRTLAETTDGFFAPAEATDLLNTTVSRMVRDLTSYYLLGYRPAGGRADGGLRRVTVSVIRRGVSTRARRSYRAVTAGELERLMTEGGQAGQTLGAGPGAIQAAIAALNNLKTDAPVRSRIAYGPTSAGRIRAWAVAEIDLATSRQGGWLGGGTVDASLSGPDNTALASTEGALAGGQRTVLLDLGELDSPDVATTLRVRFHPSGVGTRLQDQVQLAPVDDAGFGVALMSRRGPTTAGRYVPTADPRFQRTERLRWELARPAAPKSLSATLLDRTGTAMSLPIATSTRADGATSWAVADVSLAALAPGDYVLKVTIDGKDLVTGIRIIP